MTREEFLKDFQNKLFEKFPSGYQRWWPNFIFHFSDITNITSILNSGKLYSRHKAEELGLMKNDNASDDVIGNTFADYKKYVRCYFGTKTPTQYHNEGIKPVDQIQNNAHCPVPVFLLFDFVKLLSIEGVLFSSGNIAASGADIYSEISDLNKLEFEYIYDRKPLPYDDSGRGHKLYCRHAEILIPNELDVFDFLRVVCVRSEAEKETLLHGLENPVKEKLRGKIKVFNQDGIFFNTRLFVGSVELLDDKITVHFSNILANTYAVQVYGKDIKNGKKYKAQATKLAKAMHWNFEQDIGNKGFYLCIKIDDHLVYENILYREIEGII